MLDLLADAMEMPEERRSALLGRFQHLQRLKLVEGVNPGRGKAAEYSAQQVLVFAIALQMLQLGMTPERCVKILQENRDVLRMAIGLAVYRPDTISPSLLWFDPSILNRPTKLDDYDLAEETFYYGGVGTSAEAFESFFEKGWVQRMAFISVSGTLWHIVAAIEGHFNSADKPKIGEASSALIRDLNAWHCSMSPRRAILGSS